MKITKETVLQLAHLARLEVKENEIEEVQNDLEKITDFMGTLNEVNTAGIEPLIFMSDEVNVLREDIGNKSISQQEALANAPKKDSDYFRIPKVKS